MGSAHLRDPGGAASSHGPAFKGPRTIDARSIPLHQDNQTIVKERLVLDRTNPDILTNEITIIDHALTRPWTVTRNYRRLATPSAMEYVCAENNKQVVIEGEDYMIGGDGKLMPTRKDQPPPDLRKPTRSMGCRSQTPPQMKLMAASIISMVWEMMCCAPRPSKR